MNTQATTTSFVIGRDLGPAGRLVRILAAGLNLLAAGSLAGLMGALTSTHLATIVLTFVVAAVAYTGLVAVLGERMLSRIDPWLAALLVVVPLAVVFAFPGVPDAVSVGLFAYIGISQLVQAAIGYGGCEIVGIPTLVLRRRYTVYCVLNAADAMEEWFASRPWWIRGMLAVAAFLVTAALGLAAEAIGKASGFFVAYLLFLILGFAVGRLLRSREHDGRTPQALGAGGGHEIR
jgi:Family of unknown function (DUF6410)